ncbi:MAG: extracellular solute-binding protein [Desulfocapsaceae bacterium]|jgi:spermidine/putrescine transport system substrate-binding protein|nr:extracellular solute-binding protein [Desulfocapsaceae bacterium]
MKNVKMIWLAVVWIVLQSSTVLASGKVYVYNWTEYIPDAVLQQFTEETGIKVIYTTYESNEAMYAKLKLIKGEGYDLVFPSTYFVSKMRTEGMLQPLKADLVPNMSLLDQTLMDKEFDPGNVYSIPYMWGSTGIAVNTDVIPAQEVRSWKDLWRKEYRGQVLLQDDVREVFHMALKIKGYSSNSRNPEEIEQAYELLRELMPNVLLFNSDSPRLPYLAGEVNVGMIWNGEAWMAQQENSAIAYIYPSEGANFWVDSFVIPIGAKNIENAHAFINFMLRPDIAKACVEENGFATPVVKALELLDDTVRSSEVIFPPAHIVEAGEFQTDVGEALSVYQMYWEKLRSGGSSQ